MSQKQSGKQGSSPNLINACGLFHMRRAYRTASKLYVDILAHAGLDSSQFSVLNIIARSGPLSISEIANRVGLDRTTMSRNLKPLEKKQLIRTSDESDGRARLIEITAAGEAVIAEAVPRWRRAQSEFRELLGDEDMDMLITLMNRVYDATSSSRK